MISSLIFITYHDRENKDTVNEFYLPTRCNLFPDLNS